MTEWSLVNVVHLTVDLLRHAALGPALEAALGTPLPGPGRSSGTAPHIFWQGPRDWLVLGGESDALAAALSVLGPVLATPDRLAAFDLDAEALAGGTAARPADTMVCVTRFAQVRATVWGEGDRYRLLVAEPVARHVALFLSRPR